MANINDYKYKPYKWLRVHSFVERKCREIRKRFLHDMKIRQSILREDIVREYTNDSTLLSLQCIPKEELAAILQWYEMRNDINEIHCSLVFDVICNLWNYISDIDVVYYRNLPIPNQLDYLAQKKTEFLSWYARSKKITVQESQMLLRAIHMPMYHRISGHETLDLMISYLLC